MAREAPGAPAPLPLAGEAFVHLERRVACQHVIGRPRELVGQDGQRLALAVLFLQPAAVLLSGRYAL
jgi:hypothetical protein